MVLTDPQSRPQERRSSVSPRREKGKRKPRRDWLVAVGQGRSPASTRRGRGASTNSRKRFDFDNLSFSDLECQDHQLRQSRQSSGRSSAKSPVASASPIKSGTKQSNWSSDVTTTEPRSFSPRLPIQPIQTIVAADATQVHQRKSDLDVGYLATECGGAANETASPTAGKDEAVRIGSGSASISYTSTHRKAESICSKTAPPGGKSGAFTECGEEVKGDTIGSAGESRGSLRGLGSLQLESPGKEYWTGRIATPRYSESPRGGPHNTKMASWHEQDTPSTTEWSVKREWWFPDPAFGPSTASMGRSLSAHPSPRLAKSPQTSAWSTHELQSPSSGTFVGLGSGSRGRFKSSPFSRRPSPASSNTPILARQVHVRRGHVRHESGSSLATSTSTSISPLGISTFGWASQRVSWTRKTRPSDSKRGARSVSPHRKEGISSPHDIPAIPLCRAISASSPSNLPVADADGDPELDRPERTMLRRDIPERTRITAGTEGIAEGKARPSLKQGHAGERDSGEGDCPRLDERWTEDVNKGSTRSDGRDVSPSSAHCPSPLNHQPNSPSAQEPSPCDFYAHEGARTSSAGWESRESIPSRRSQHGASAPMRLHVPPGVRAEVTARRSSASSREASTGSSSARPAQAAAPNLRVSTPTGDGGAADLSLWITLRGLEDQSQETPTGFSCPSPANMVSPRADLASGASEHGSARGSGGGSFAFGVDADRMVCTSPVGQPSGFVKTQVRTPNAGDGRSAIDAGFELLSTTLEGRERRGRTGADRCAADGGKYCRVEYFWEKISRALCGLLNFCRPRESDYSPL